MNSNNSKKESPYKKFGVVNLKLPNGEKMHYIIMSEMEFFNLKVLVIYPCDEEYYPYDFKEVDFLCKYKNKTENNEVFFPNEKLSKLLYLEYKKRLH